MKKIIALLILAALTLGITGCAEEPVEKAGLQVGYSRILVNPVESIPMSGYGNHSQRFSRDITDDLYATCIAITGTDGNTVLLMTVDMAVGYASVTEPARNMIAQTYGVPYENIYISGTHTHSGPAIGYTDNPAMAAYMEQLVNWMVEAGKVALDDRAPASLFTGSVETEGMNFTRHYIARDKITGQTSVIGDNFGSPISKVLEGHTSEADPTMHLVKFTREGRKDIVLANWRAHPHFTGGTNVYNLSADFVGTFRTAIETLYPCDFAYFQGAAGNVNENSRIASEEACVEYRTYGSTLANYAIQGLENMKPVSGDSISTTQISFEASINHSFDDLYFKAKEVRVIWQTTYDSNQTMAVAEPYGIRSPYHADAIVSNYNLPETQTINLNAARIGNELSFVTFPGEYFDMNSVYIEEHSPFDTTLFLGYCNDHYGYMPAKLAYEYTSYETDITRFAENTAEEVREVYVQTLTNLYEEK